MKDKRMMDGTKMLWHMDRVLAWERGERIPPIYIDMGANKKCNVNCVYCYGNYQHMTGEEIAREPLVNLFRDATSVGIKGIGLIGDGEPTLNPAIYEAMDEGKRTGLDMAISTNGVLLDKCKLENILGNCKWMRFNISAGTKEGYRVIHSADKYDNVVDNIKEAVRLKKEKGYTCDIGLQSVFVPKLMDGEIIILAELSKKLGVDYFLIKQCSLPEGNSSVNKVSFNERDMIDSEEYLKMAEAVSPNIFVKWGCMDMQRNMISTGKRPYDGCLGIPFLLQISGNGKVYPCGHLFGKEEDKYLMGDLHKNSIGEIIKSERYWEVVDMMKDFDVHNDCHGMCRQDKVNEFLYEYMQKPRGINFI